MLIDSKNNFHNNSMQANARTGLGKAGEQLVADYLKKQGFTILEHNYRKPFGEIDLIATNHELVIFVEVKTRSKNYFNLSQVVVPSKQRKMIKVAKYYLLYNPVYNKNYRFDVALIQDDNPHERITYIPNAFTQAEGRY